jgi:hypothetical protein
MQRVGNSMQSVKEHGLRLMRQVSSGVTRSSASLTGSPATATAAAMPSCVICLESTFDVARGECAACTQGHSMCSECLSNYVSSICDEPAKLVDIHGQVFVLLNPSIEARM